MEDYKKYLSYDNGNGLLFSYDDKIILDRYNINYSVDDIDILMYEISEYLDNDYDEELEDVLIHLSEFKYYNYTKK